MSSEAILKAGVQAVDVDKFIREKLLPVCDGEPLDLVIAACLTLLVSSIGPEDLTGDELFKAVEETSAAMILSVSSLRTKPSETN